MNLSTLDKLSYTLELSDTLVELSYTLQWCFHLSCRGYFGGIFSPFFPSLFCFLYWNCILGWSICSCCYCPSHPLPLPHSLWKPVSMSACLFLSIPRKWSREVFFFFFFVRVKCIHSQQCLFISIATKVPPSLGSSHYTWERCFLTVFWREGQWILSHDTVKL